MSPTPARGIAPSPRRRRWVRRIAVAGAGVGALLGLAILVLHLTTDPLIDIRRYYEAGRRLNQGLPLYGLVSADMTATYLNPPLLAILFRPLALLPFPVAAAAWEAIVLASLALTVWRAGLNRRVLVVMCWLALPICWALVIGQVEIVLTLLLSFGTPAAVALAGSVKLFPWLAAVYWVGRRQWRSLGGFVAWAAALFLFQLLVEPAATLAFIRLEWLDASFEVRNFSLWVIHPVLWLAGAIAAGVAAIRLAGTRWGWSAAVAFTVMANPRLLMYQLTTLLAALSGPGRPILEEAVLPQEARAPSLRDVTTR
jgi:hypothetical protein